jgi:osmoprotectant transport system substrate-binding protein
MRRFRSTVLGAALLALALLTAACAQEPGGGGTPDGKASLTVGADNFAEAEIVAEMYAQVLENAGYDVSREFGTTRATRLPAMESGDIDLAPDYLASLLLELDPEAEASSDPAAVARDLTPLLQEKGLTTLEASPAIDTNGFVVTGETAQEHGLQTMSDLQPVAGQLTLGGAPECPERPFCIPGLQKVYGIEFADFVPLDACGPLVVEALDTGEVDVGMLCTTQSVIAEKGWVLLEDDKHLQAADSITPLIRSDLVNDEITQLLNAVSAALTTETMTELNGRVEIDGEDPAIVAEDFLNQQRLL